MAPNLRTLTRMSVLTFIFHCIMKRDGIDRMFPFAKRDNSEWGLRHDAEINKPAILIKSESQESISK